MSADSAHRLLVASNRGPVTFRVADGGEFVARRGGGGLVTALSGLARHHDVTWVSHVMGDGDEAMRDSVGGRAFEEHARGGGSYNLRLVGSVDGTYHRHYLEIANPLLWFLQHRLYGFGWDPTVDRAMHRAWGCYRDVNERIATALAEELEAHEGEGEPPFVMVHDYHLFLVPGMLRSRLAPTAQAPFLQFFLHIPWPDPGAWRALPRSWARSVCESLLACDVVGFQTHRDAENFLRTVHHFLGASVEFRTGTVRYMGSVTRVRTYPISVAVDEFEEHAASATVERLRGRIAAMRPTPEDGSDGKLIVRVDRTDPSKNIVRGFRAYALLLEEHPELHGCVSMFCQLDPSRQDITEYVDYLVQVKAAATDINRRFSTSTWTPVHVNLDSNFQAGVAAYREYDVLFVNPVADGMNLVSKEGPLVNERDGVVVLSDQAGSFNELGPNVVPVNPFDVAQQADALLEALRMPHPERAERAQALRRQVIEHDVIGWMSAQLDDIAALQAGRPLEAR
ncbi:MAG: Trehalose-6-phosphate synthase [Thermoleophilia bacterium]|nr:Trehalose-6-phosphate synthase [Thermoleophilia bacterium]